MIQDVVDSKEVDPLQDDYPLLSREQESEQSLKDLVLGAKNDRIDDVSLQLCVYVGYLLCIYTLYVALICTRCLVFFVTFCVLCLLSILGCNCVCWLSCVWLLYCSAGISVEWYVYMCYDSSPVAATYVPTTVAPLQFDSLQIATHYQ